MGDNKTSTSLDRSDLSDISLRGFYVISATATALGVVIVFVLNLATPLEFTQARFAELSMEKGTAPLVFAIIMRLFFLCAMIVAVSIPSVLAMHEMLRPIRKFLGRLKMGKRPQASLVNRAKRRLINLPFIAIAVNVGMWFFIPALVFLYAYLTALMDLKTAMVFSVRASMVGLIATSIAFYRIESYSRRKVIPHFFPNGRLAELQGAANLSISRRIRMFFRFGSLVPGTVLLVTLLTIQWELDPTVTSVDEFGRDIILFTVVLSAVFFLTTGALNRLVARSIVEPLNEMLRHVDMLGRGDFSPRIRVVSNDEIGVLGDAGNRMIRGLADRQTIRTAFGKYVTPEIRDEILSGRIPLRGERREATVMFVDLRNFTPFVENNSPEEVITGMRAYFTGMHQAIRRNRGVVLQFVGDGIEAAFGVPVPFEDHADAAMRAALAMRRALDELNAKRSTQGKSTFAHGVGIHSGSVLAGNSGSEDQSAYALIGSTVNLASRIEGATKELGCDILASRDTVRMLKGSYQMEEQPSRFFKGYSKPVVLYRIS